MYSHDEKENPNREFKPVQFPPTWDEFLEKHQGENGEFKNFKFKSSVDGLAFIHSLNGEGAQIKLVKDGDKVIEIHILL